MNAAGRLAGRSRRYARATYLDAIGRDLVGRLPARGAVSAVARAAAAAPLTVAAASTSSWMA